jgi:hypothetical protein
MEYHDVEKMIHMIGKQLQRMEAMDKGIASFNLDDISVFYTHPHRVTSSNSASRGDTDSASDDDTDTDSDTDDDETDTATVIHFALTNDDKVCDFDAAEQQHLKITTPYKPEYTSSSSSHKPGHNTAFISPEFKDFISKKTLPYSIHFKSGYYSFGLLCVYCFVSKTAVAPATNADADAAVDAVLTPIIHTKIYWFLKRVLDENPTARRYLCS